MGAHRVLTSAGDFVYSVMSRGARQVCGVGCVCHVRALCAQPTTQTLRQWRFLKISEPRRWVTCSRCSSEVCSIFISKFFPLFLLNWHLFSFERRKPSVVRPGLVERGLCPDTCPREGESRDRDPRERAPHTCTAISGVAVGLAATTHWGLQRKPAGARLFSGHQAALWGREAYVFSQVGHVCGCVWA